MIEPYSWLEEGIQFSSSVLPRQVARALRAFSGCLGVCLAQRLRAGDTVQRRAGCWVWFCVPLSAFEPELQQVACLVRVRWVVFASCLWALAQF